MNRQPIQFLDWMTKQAVDYLKDPRVWLENGPIALPLDEKAAAAAGLWGSGVKPISIRPSELPPLARFGPPPGAAERLPIEEVM